MTSTTVVCEWGDFRDRTPRLLVRMIYEQTTKTKFDYRKTLEKLSKARFLLLHVESR